MEYVERNTEEKKTQGQRQCIQVQKQTQKSTIMYFPGTKHSQIGDICDQASFYFKGFAGISGRSIRKQRRTGQ